MKNDLPRKLGLFPITNIVISNMIGAGIFTTSGLLMADLHNPLIMLALWLVGGIIALCGALCYGEIGAAFPRAGGEYVFLTRLYHPIFGFLSGWISFVVGFSAPIAASAIGFSEYLLRAFPQILAAQKDGGFFNPMIVQKIIASLVIIFFTFIHHRGIAFGAKIQNWLTVLKMFLIVGLVLAGLFLGHGDIQHFSQGENFSFDFTGWKTVGLALMWIMFAYSGWNAATYIGSEIKSPGKNLPLSLLLGSGIVMALYLSLNILFIYAVPPQNMKGVIAIGGLAVANLFGESMAKVFSLLISFALFSSLSAFIILGPRVYYAMAKDGYFFKFVASVHPVSRVPSKSITLQCLIALVMVFSGTFDQILTYMGFSLGIFPLLTVFGVFKLRATRARSWKLPGYPLVPSIYLFMGITMLVLSFFQRPGASSIALATVLIGIPLFFLFKQDKY